MTRSSMAVLSIGALSLLACDGLLSSTDMPDAMGERDGSPGDAPDTHVNTPPVASFVVTTSDRAGGGLDVHVDASESRDADGTIEVFAWDFGGVGVGTGVVTDYAFTEPGCFVVSLRVTDDAGASGEASEVVASTGASPASANVVFSASPIDSAVLPRDVVRNLGTATYRGTVDSPGVARLVARVTSADEEVAVERVSLCGEPPYDFELNVPIPVELRSFDVAISIERSGESVEVHRSTDLVAGDIFVVQGQSNAVSDAYTSDGGENDSPFIRSFGVGGEVDPDADRRWRSANEAGPHHFGQWPLRMAAQLSAAYGLPIGILNGAVGGRPIEYFARNAADPSDPTTNYGRLHRRLSNADLIGRVRLFFWYQGESDGARYEAHRDGFRALYEDWLTDFPGFERTYITQIRFGCGGDLNRTQEVQRAFGAEFEAITVMSTTAIDAHDGCHYAYVDGYRELGDRYAALVARDLYGDVPTDDVEPPNPLSARFSADRTEVIVQMSNPDSVLSYEDGAYQDFLFEGTSATFSGGRVEGSQLILSVAGDASGATALHYRGRPGPGQWVTNERGVGLLAFYGLPLE